MTSPALQNSKNTKVFCCFYISARLPPRCISENFGEAQDPSKGHHETPEGFLGSQIGTKRAPKPLQEHPKAPNMPHMSPKILKNEPLKPIFTISVIPGCPPDTHPAATTAKITVTKRPALLLGSRRQRAKPFRTSRIYHYIYLLYPLTPIPE